jgi:competence protein ComEA
VKTTGLAALLGVVLVGGAVLALRWPSQKPALDCPAAEVHLDEQGVAHCGPGRPLPAGQALSAGGKLDLNKASADDLALVSGIGPALAKALVDERTRLGKFSSWDEVDAVPGVGEVKLAALKNATEIR